MELCDDFRDETPTRVRWFEGRVYLADVAAEVHRSEDEVTAFALKHLPDGHVNEEAGTVSNEGAEALRTFLTGDAY